MDKKEIIMLNQPIMDKLSVLKLNGMLDALREQMENQQYKKLGNGLVVKTKDESFFRCISFIMLPPISSEDKPREACHIPSVIDAASGYYISR